MTTELSQWKLLLDQAQTAHDADLVIRQAFAEGSRDQLLDLLGDLFREFQGPDEEGGGAAGTLERMRRIHDDLRPTAEELREVGINPDVLKSYLGHA